MDRAASSMSISTQPDDSPPGAGDDSAITKAHSQPNASKSLPAEMQDAADRRAVGEDDRKAMGKSSI